MKKEKGSALPVFLLLLVLAFIGGVSYYKFMVYDKKDNKPKENNTVVDNGNANNNKEENNNNNNENNNNSNNNDKNDTKVPISKELEEKIKKEVKEQKIPYTYIVTDKTSYAKVYEKYVLKNVFEKLEKDGVEDYKYNEVDTEGVNIIDYIYLNFGFTKDQLTNVYKNENIYEENFSGGSWPPSIYKGETVRNKLKEMYNYDLNYTSTQHVNLYNFCGTKHFIYEKELDVFIKKDDGGCTCGWSNDRTIIDSSYKDNIYTIKYIDTVYTWVEGINDGCSVVNNKGKETTIQCFRKECGEGTDKLDDDLTNYSLSHKDELPQYEISFKINSDNTYEFVNIKKVN